MKAFFFLTCITFSFRVTAQNVLPKPEGEYCDKAGNLVAFCIVFKGDTFYSGISSMMFAYVGKGTYAINDNRLTLTYCKADSTRDVDGTVRAGTIVKYTIKKLTPTELILKREGDKNVTTLKREKE